MKQAKQQLAILIALLAVTSTGFCQKSEEGSSNAGIVVDTARAVNFFADQLNFLTNIHGVKNVVDGTTKDVTIVDVRRAEDFAAGHIPGAINLPFDKYKSFEGTDNEFPGLRKNGYNYIYCYAHMCNLAQKAAKKFAGLGYPVKEAVGGFAAWQEHKYPIDK